MKKMTCRQLGGACDQVFMADTFEEIKAMSKAHGLEMYHQKEAAHLEAMNKMRDLMKSPEAMTEWYNNKRKEFEALPDE